MTDNPIILRQALAVGEAMVAHVPRSELMLVPRTNVMVIKTKELVELSDVHRVLRNMGYNFIKARKANFEQAFYTHFQLNQGVIP